MDEGIEDVLDRVDEPVVRNALVQSLESYPDVTGHRFGDMMVFEYGNEPPIVYEAGNGFWSEEAYQDSWMSSVQEGIKRVSVYHPGSDEPLVPTQYDPREYDTAFGLMADLHRQEPDGLLVFDLYDRDSPLVYDVPADRFWSPEEYGDSLYFALEEVGQPDKFRSVLDGVEEAVSRYDTYSMFKDPGRRGTPTVIGAAADGEGFVVGRSGSHLAAHTGEEFDINPASLDEESEIYHLVHTKAATPLEGWMEKTETVIERVTSVAFDPADIPNGGWAYNKPLFAQNHILLQYADRNGEVAAEYHRAYLNGRRDDQFERLLPPGHK